MSKQKSVTVTVIIAVLAGIVIFAAYRMWQPAFIIMASALAGVGFWSAAVNLCSWLEAESLTPEEAVEPIKIEREPDLGEDFTTTYDEIRREMEADL